MTLLKEGGKTAFKCARQLLSFGSTHILDLSRIEAKSEYFAGVKGDLPDHLSRKAGFS